MSFRARLTSFFVLIVVMPMLAIGILVFRLIDDSQKGKADARISSVANVALSVYQNWRVQANADAESLAREVALFPGRALPARLAALQSAAGLVRVGVRVGGRSIYDHGPRTAIAPGVARVQEAGRQRIKVAASELTADQYARELTAPGVGVVIRQRGQTLGSSFSGPVPALPERGTVQIGGQRYRVLTDTLVGYGTAPVILSVLSSLSATASATGTTRVVALAFIFGFLILALAFALLSSRGLQAQLRSFLQAARRLGAGNFSAPIEIQGSDEFASLGQEFNNMSAQLEQRIDELGQERRRLRESLLRIGQLFASNLDRRALLDLALHTAVDAVQAGCGRVSSRASQSDPLSEMVRIGTLDEFEAAVVEAERRALHEGPLCEITRDGYTVAAVALQPASGEARAHGIITVARQEAPFTEDDRDLLRSLAAQATVALENVNLHQQVSRQAVTDQLTGLANHGRFQEILTTEVEQVRRYHTPLGLILLDIDNFKSVNDTYGHQQGDQVLRDVAQVLRESSREADMPARYGGEEMALILPHTDLEGAYAIAERVRTAIEQLRVRMVDGSGELRVTASLGVATMVEGEKAELVGIADAALYRAKRSGKNRTERATLQPADVVRAG